MSPLGAARAIITAGGAVVDPGKLTLLETKTLSTAAAEFTSLDVSTYNVHLFVYSDLITPASTQSEFTLRVSDDGGSSYETANYQFGNQRGFASGTFAERKSQSQASIRLFGDLTGSANGKGNGYCYMYNAGDSSKFTFFTNHNSFFQTNVAYGMEFGSSVYAVASTINAVRFAFGAVNGTNIESGKISAFGIAES
tara:strand:- start:2463 stop:3050 length:588 start_codon:yes stop_codon:yes gene_type:complete